eukprot:scaffold14569_cov49-Cyclotella_meneghiniana.AAC.7
MCSAFVLPCSALFGPVLPVPPCCALVWHDLPVPLGPASSRTDLTIRRTIRYGHDSSLAWKF